MVPEGIRVAEVDLNLPNSCYYLYWEPAPPPIRYRDRRRHVEAAHRAGDALGWTLFATGADAEAARLLFETATDNLDAGLEALLPNVRRHALYLVQPETALTHVAQYIHRCTRPREQGSVGRGEPMRLPEVHYGLLIGERAWAEAMFDSLVGRAAGPAPRGRPPSLPDIAMAHASREEAIAEAYRSGAFSLKDIAEYFGMHFSDVSAVINASGPRCAGGG